MKFRVGVAMGCTNVQHYAVHIPLAEATTDSAMFLVGFVEDVFRLPAGAIFTYEPMGEPNGWQGAYLKLLSHSPEFIGDLDPADIRMLYQKRFLVAYIEARNERDGEE